MRLPLGTSEVELINVILRKYHDVTEHHVVANDGHFAKSAGLDGCCFVLEFACRQCLRDMNRQIAQIDCVPQDHRSDIAVVNKFLHVVWRGKASDQYLSALATLLHGFSSSRKRNRAEPKDSFETRILADHILTVCESIRTTASFTRTAVFSSRLRQR